MQASCVGECCLRKAMLPLFGFDMDGCYHLPGWLHILVCGGLMMRVPQDVSLPRVLIMNFIGNLIVCLWCSLCVSPCGILAPDIHPPAISAHMLYPVLSLFARALFGSLL